MRGENRLKTKSKAGHCHLARPQTSTSRNKNADFFKPTFVSVAILSALAYSSHYFPFEHHYFSSESVNLFRTLNRATIGHLGEGGKHKTAHPSPTPWCTPSGLSPQSLPRFPINAWTIFCKMATHDDQVYSYLKQEIHGRLHNHSLFTSLESFKIWPCELKNRTRILSPERAARRHFGEKQWNVPTR